MADNSFNAKRQAAMALYTPPFRFRHGYIFDASHSMVADQGGPEDSKSVEATIARVRGWGRISYMANAAELQDEVGSMMADAMTDYYNKPVPEWLIRDLITLQSSCSTDSEQERRVTAILHRLTNAKRGFV